MKKLVGIGFERVVGIEPSKAPIMQADESIREFIINDMFIPENFQENSIDLISCFQTLEHIYAPSQIVEGIFKLLKKEGMIYIVSHSYEALTTKILKKKSPIFDIEHLQLFSPKGLKLMLENNGFKDIRIFKIKNKYPLSYLVKLFPFPKGLKCILLDFLNKTNIGNVEISLNIGNIGAIAKK